MIKINQSRIFLRANWLRLASANYVIDPSILEFFFVQVGEGLLEKYHKIAFNDYVMSRGEEMMWCPTPGCDFGFEFAEKFHRFDCRLCNKS